MDDYKIIRKKEIEAVLSSLPTQGKHQLEPLKSLFIKKLLPFGIMEDHEVSSSEVESEIHKKEGDLFFCLEGKAEFICNGEIIDPWIKEESEGNEIGGHGIKNGTAIILKTGDWLWIPPGVPHQHSSAKTARLMIIKIPKVS